MLEPQRTTAARDSDETERGTTRSKRLLVALFVLALAGVASLALAPVGSVAPPEISPVAFRWLALVQPALLATGAALVGYVFAHRVGLDAPLLREFLQGRPAGRLLLRQMAAGVVGATLAGAVLLTYSAVTAGALPETFVLPLATRLLYGGVTEEIIARWGVMSFFVWVSWRLDGRYLPVRSRHVWIGISAAALLFALAHLPLVFALGGAAPDTWIIAAVLVANLLPGLVFGWLYARLGLEAAMLAHAGAHVMAASFA